MAWIEPHGSTCAAADSPGRSRIDLEHRGDRGHRSDDDAQLVPADASSSHTEGVVATTLSELVEGEPVGVVEQAAKRSRPGARPARARSCTGRGRAHRRESRGGLESTPRPRSLWPPTSARGSSAAASACAIEPQTVPRLRVTVWPTWGRTAASAGCASSRGSAWRTVAPTLTVLLSLVTSSRPATRFTSTRSDGRSTRMFSAGTRLCPPARIFASSPPAASELNASSSDSGRTYSNRAGFTSGAAPMCAPA